MNPLEAHAKLSAMLPITEHRIKDDQPALVKPGTMRRVRINGVLYKNLRAAALSMKCSPHTIYRWLDDGRAEFA